jgi:ATP-dependent helicase HrpB
VLPELIDMLAAHGTAVLVAPPGTGKTTLVPLALAAAAQGRVVVAEPRRLAARAAAARMAMLLGERVGETVGYSIRGERRTSRRTRIEVVTSGLLVRRLQADPELAATGTVLLDECHERHLDADLLLALLLDARAGLRPDLRLLATSATVDTGRLAELLGDAPVLRVEARTFEVIAAHVPPARAERIEGCVARAVRLALAESDGDVLAFLPGVGEIHRTAARLSAMDELAGVAVVPLHGRQRGAEQDAALRPGATRRVVLATAVAESSLTVPGVRAVVDSGLARVPRMDHRRGLPGLVTVRVSDSVARQRAGRAGREAPGRVYRCWPEHEQATLPRQPEPEIQTADLTALALELACWGTPDGSALTWWTPPPAGPLDAGRQVLTVLGALDPVAETVTDRGRRMVGLGVHPRLARALLDGSAEVGALAAAEVVALLGETGGGDGADRVDLVEALRAVRDGHSESARRWRTEVDRLLRLLDAPGDTGRRAGADAAALVTGLAQPERLARRRGDSSVYLLAGGTAVELPPGGLTGASWLAVARADREPGRVHGRIRLAARADEALAVRAAPALLRVTDEVAWVDGDVRARRVRALGAIVLAERPLSDPDPAAVRDAVLVGLRAGGTGLLGWDETATRLRERLAFLHRVLGPPWPAVDEAALLAVVEDRLRRVRDRAGLGRIRAGDLLRELLPWPAAARLDELAPDRLTVPSGSTHRVDYGQDPPVLAVRVQEVFGWTTTPTLADGRVGVLLHLLSPAGRPAAITADLTSFWHTGYPAVRADLRGRYPKHRWPEDPMTAQPTRRGTR